MTLEEAVRAWAQRMVRRIRAHRAMLKMMHKPRVRPRTRSRLRLLRSKRCWKWHT